MNLNHSLDRLKKSFISESRIATGANETLLVNPRTTKALIQIKRAMLINNSLDASRLISRRLMRFSRVDKKLPAGRSALPVRKLHAAHGVHGQNGCQIGSGPYSAHNPYLEHSLKNHTQLAPTVKLEPDFILQPPALQRARFPRNLTPPTPEGPRHLATRKPHHSTPLSKNSSPVNVADNLQHISLQSKPNEIAGQALKPVSKYKVPTPPKRVSPVLHNGTQVPRGPTPPQVSNHAQVALMQASQRHQAQSQLDFNRRQQTITNGRRLLGTSAQVCCKKDGAITSLGSPVAASTVVTHPAAGGFSGATVKSEKPDFHPTGHPTTPLADPLQMFPNPMAQAAYDYEDLTKISVEPLDKAAASTGLTMAEVSSFGFKQEVENEAQVGALNAGLVEGPDFITSGSSGKSHEYDDSISPFEHQKFYLTGG